MSNFWKNLKNYFQSLAKKRGYANVFPKKWLRPVNLIFKKTVCRPYDCRAKCREIAFETSRVWVQNTKDLHNVIILLSEWNLGHLKIFGVLHFMPYRDRVDWRNGWIVKMLMSKREPIPLLEKMFWKRMFLLKSTNWKRYKN